MSKAKQPAPAKLIRTWRGSQRPKLSQQQLARAVGSSKGSISRIENGKQAITIEMGQRFARETGIPLRSLCPKLAEAFA